MPTITTDDLTPETARSVIELYCRKGEELDFRSPGRIATERFVEEVVLPYAEAIQSDPAARAAIELILRDAGERHNRRYPPPWKLH